MSISSDYKVILQKDIPDRNRLSRFKFDRIHNSLLLANISKIFEGENVSKPYGIWLRRTWLCLPQSFFFCKMVFFEMVKGNIFIFSSIIFQTENGIG